MPPAPPPPARRGQDSLASAVPERPSPSRARRGRFRALALPARNRRRAQGHRSPVTAADVGAERLIRGHRRRYPSHAIVGEELGANAGGASHRWFVDPIDGTRSFVHGVPLFGVLLGLEIDGEMVVGVATCRRRRDAGRSPRTGLHMERPSRAGLVEDLACRGDGGLLRLPASRAAPRTALDRASGRHGPPARVGRLLRSLSGRHRAGRRDARSGDESLGLRGARADSSGERRPDYRLAGPIRIDGGDAVSTNGHLHDDVLGALGCRHIVRLRARTEGRATIEGHAFCVRPAAGPLRGVAAGVTRRPARRPRGPDARGRHGQWRGVRRRPARARSLRRRLEHPQEELCRRKREPRGLGRARAELQAARRSRPVGRRRARGIREMLARIGQSHFAILPAPVASDLSGPRAAARRGRLARIRRRSGGRASHGDRASTPTGPRRARASGPDGFSAASPAIGGCDALASAPGRRRTITSVTSALWALGTALLRGRTGTSTDLTFLDGAGATTARQSLGRPSPDTR